METKTPKGQSPSDGASPVVVVETGSAKPVTDQVNTKAATQPKSPSANPVPANPAATDANKPPQPVSFFFFRNFHGNFLIIFGKI